MGSGLMEMAPKRSDMIDQSSDFIGQKGIQEKIIYCNLTSLTFNFQLLYKVCLERSGVYAVHSKKEYNAGGSGIISYTIH